MTGDSGIVTGDSGKQPEIGHDKTEWTVTFTRNRRSRSNGMGGHDGPEYACSTENPAKMELFIRTVGQRWSQAKYKKKLRGKQHNFILTKETNNQLNKLKKTWGVSRSQVIERLIQAEFKAEEAQLSGPPGAESATASTDANQ